jgi:hypothetical protein
MLKLLKRVAIALGTIALSLAGLFVIVSVYSTYRNQAADRDAIAFCSQFPPGSDIQPAIAKAQREAVRHREMNDGRLHQFIFFGAIFYGKACELGVANGKVTTSGQRVYGD